LQNRDFAAVFGNLLPFLLTANFAAKSPVLYSEEPGADPGKDRYEGLTELEKNDPAVRVQRGRLLKLFLLCKREKEDFPQD